MSGLTMGWGRAVALNEALWTIWRLRTALYTIRVDSILKKMRIQTYRTNTNSITTVTVRVWRSTIKMAKIEHEFLANDGIDLRCRLINVCHEYTWLNTFVILVTRLLIFLFTISLLTILKWKTTRNRSTINKNTY